MVERGVTMAALQRACLTAHLRIAPSMVLWLSKEPGNAINDHLTETSKACRYNRSTAGHRLAKRHDPNGKHLEQKLECQVRVMRVEPRDVEGTYGLACQIEDYHFIQTVATELQ